MKSAADLDRDSRPLEILVIDDEEADSRVVCRWLEQMRQPRARAQAANTGDAARAHLAAKRFDAVILDRMLGGEDGVEILRALRASPLNAGAVVIVASGLVEEPGFGDGLLADAYITKPYTDEMLRLRLRVALRGRLPREEEE